MNRHDWNNNDTNCKNLGLHNSRYQIKDFSWYKYYIYPNTEANVRLDCFEFYPYWDSSSGPSPMPVIVDNYDNKNALTYPLEYNWTQKKFPANWGVQDFNDYKIIDKLKYNIENKEYCPVVLEPGTVVYATHDISVSGYTGDVYMFFKDNKLTLGRSASDGWDADKFIDKHLPRRILVELQGGGGGGGGGQCTAFVLDGQGGGGGAAGGYIAIVLNLDPLYNRDPDTARFRFHIGFKPERVSGETNGKDGDDTILYFETRNSTSSSEWTTTTLVTCKGGEGGSKGASNYVQHLALGGDVELNEAYRNTYFWVLYSAKGANGSVEGGKGGDADWVPINTRDNDNHKAGSWFARQQNGGKCSYKGGGGGASYFHRGGNGGTREGDANSAEDGSQGSGGGGGLSWCNGSGGSKGEVYIYLDL